MKFLILHAHWNNRGDEAALRALTDNLTEIYPDSEIRVQLISDITEQFPNTENVSCFPTCLDGNSAWRRKCYPEFFLALLSKGKTAKNKELKHFWDCLNWCDFVIHAPGGPSIGEIYREHERFYLWRFICARRANKPYMFYAPSAGPFTDKKRNIIRRYIYEHAADICLREQISADYVKGLGVNNNITVTLDSALQRDIDESVQANVFDEYHELKEFMHRYKRIVGITISDLSWNSLYKNDSHIEEKIKSTFVQFIKQLKTEGYGVIFIPQLFGRTHDKDYMMEFMDENCFMVDDEHDCYFQQYLIGKLYAVVGMRYHSNVFSAKMSVPFVSVTYEQKMQGFMNLIGLNDYCININQLNYSTLNSTFENVLKNYDSIKRKLSDNHSLYKSMSFETTNHLIKMIEQNI